MSAERCPDCDVEGVPCACAGGARFDSLRVRPYVGLPAQAAEHDTPAYGIPAPPPAGAAGYAGSPAGSPGTPHRPDETLLLRPVAAEDRWRAGGAGRGGGGSGGGGGRRGLPLLAGAGALVAIGAAAAALTLFSDSGEADRALPDPTPSGPAVSVEPVGPTATPSARSGSPSASASRSASASDRPSRSASPSASVSTPPKSSPPPTASASAAPPAPAPPQGPPVLRRGDSGQEVRDLQQQLKRLDYFHGRTDGRYGSSTEDAVADFQRDFDVTGDPRGVYGPATRQALEDWGWGW